MIFRAHRGGCYYTPENTLPAFKKAIADGYEQIETDPQLTKDGVIVLIHDDTVNRTCRYSDGSPIEKPMYVCDMMYEELSKLDAGIFMGEEFRGTKIPRLEELLELLSGTDIVLSLDKKIPTDKIDFLLDLVKKYDVRVEFSTADRERIKKILSSIPCALINYDGPNTEQDLQAVAKIVPPSQLTVWIYLDKPNFSWLTDREKASKELCARVKKYATLGIANITSPEDVREALLFEPDIIEV